MDPMKIKFILYRLIGQKPVFSVFFLVLLLLLSIFSQSLGDEQKGIHYILPDIERVTPRIHGKLDSDLITESSGLVKSRTQNNVFWTHNDSGDSARLFAVDSHGKLIMPSDTTSYNGITVYSAENIDWEGITTDNSGKRYSLLMLLADQIE